MRLPLAASLGLALLTCSRRGDVPPRAPSPPPTAPSPSGPMLDLEALGPYLDGPARDAVASGDLEAARGALTPLTSSETPAVRRAATILLAWAKRDLPNAPGLVDELVALAESEPLLAPWLRLWAAERAMKEGDLVRGAGIAAGVVESGPAGWRARLSRADAAWSRRDFAAAEALYRAHVDAGRGGRILGARLRIAQCIAAQPLDDARAAEAARLATRVRSSTTDEATVRAARETFERIATRLDDAARARWTAADAGDRVRVAEDDFQAQRSRESEARWTAILGSLPPRDPSRCHAALRIAQSVRKLRDHPRAASLFDAAIAACAGDAERVEAVFLAARSYEAAGDAPTAIARFASLEAEFAAHTYADDARLRRAELLRESGDESGFQAAAETLAADYPDGDMRGEALFRLAAWARAKGNQAGALAYLDEHLARVPREDGFRTAGRTLYWRGRVLAAMGRAADARASWERAFREYPFSFYALLALSRLEETDAAAARALTDELARDPGDPEGWRFPLDDTLRGEAFQRAVELLRLGLRDEAIAELDALGLAGDDASADRRWLVAVLLSRAGDARRSHEIVRRRIDGWERRPPIGTDKKRWLLAYPRAFDALAREAATPQRLPADLLLAFMREESAFDPRIESGSNAVGLMQLIAPTARRFARPLSLPHDPRALRRPEVNVRIGAAYVRFLFDEFDGGLPFVVAGYNAGETAVGRWVAACPSGRTSAQAIDDFVESISYDETRGYTKRVISTYAIYRFLDGGVDAIPRLPLVVNRPECALQQ